MKTEEQNAPEIVVEEAGDPLGAPDSQEESDWTPDDLNEEQLKQYERGVAAIDEFLKDERTKQYEPTDANREKLLAYLEQHDLPLSFGGLYVAFEQLSEAAELELSSEEENQRADEEHRGNRSSESEEDAEESEPESEEPKTARGNPSWRGEMASRSKLELNVKRAVYKDQQGHTYSAPVIFRDGQWLMHTFLVLSVLRSAGYWRNRAEATRKE